MPCVEGDRSDCQLEASSGKSNVHSPCLSLYFRLICKTQRVEHELVEGLQTDDNSLTFGFCTASYVPLSLQNEMAAK